MQKTVGLFILEILPFVLDCKLSFFSLGLSQVGLGMYVQALWLQKEATFYV